MDFYEFSTYSLYSLALLIYFFTVMTHFILRLCACDLMAYSFYWRNCGGEFSHSNYLTLEWRGSALLPLIKSGKYRYHLKDYSVKWNKDRLCTTEKSICRLIALAVRRGDRLQGVIIVKVRNKCKLSITLSIKRCCPSAPSVQLSPMDVRHPAFLCLPIYSPDLGGTTDQSVADNQC